MTRAEIRSVVGWALLWAVVFIALDLCVLHDPPTEVGGWVALMLVRVSMTLDNRRYP